MSANLTLLDRALILAHHELEAMRNGDVESAESHFHERTELMRQAADTLDEETSEDYRVKLIALQGYNQLIHEEGRELLEQIRSQLVSARSTIRGVKGYARARLLQ